LDEYFRRDRKVFTIPISYKGTPFQKKVWKELTNIPFGQCLSYKEIAKRLGDSKTARAVGLANSQNPIAIIIPCHRVVGSNKRLIGYAGGIWRKKWLLDHELHHQKTLETLVSSN
jgi:methylated-DNA-[protein]-cysteine S-methyltransferase